MNRYQHEHHGGVITMIAMIFLWPLAIMRMQDAENPALETQLRHASRGTFYILATISAFWLYDPSSAIIDAFKKDDGLAWTVLGVIAALLIFLFARTVAAYRVLWWAAPKGTLAVRAAIKIVAGAILLWYAWKFSDHTLEEKLPKLAAMIAVYWMLITGTVRFALLVGTLRWGLEYLRQKAANDQIFGTSGFSDDLRK